MTVAIQYSHRPSPPGQVIGLDVAVSDFLRAWFRYGAQDRFIVLPEDNACFDHFCALAAEEGVTRDRCVGLNPRTPQHNLSALSCVFRPDPAIAALAWSRQAAGNASFAACGLVHAMSGEDPARAMLDICLAPTDARDALICPSRAIESVIKRFWELNADYLNGRFHGAFSCPVKTSVVPLGINTEKFAARTASALRSAQRAALSIADDEVVILFTGRLSFVTKAHPLPLILAAEKAAAKCQSKLRLVFHGYFKPAEDESAFRALVDSFTDKVRVDFVMNDDPRFSTGAWALADIFASLIDNVQESFGLTPVEAMACSLPVVLSDWDGYREAITDGTEGFLIPTTMPPAMAGEALASDYFNFRNYGVYVASAAQSCSVAIEKAAEAFALLADNRDLRRRMGAAGAQRARDVYDWRNVIPTYRGLWDVLGKDSRPAPLSYNTQDPCYPNPYDLFSGFPTDVVQTHTRLRLIGDSVVLDSILMHEMNMFAPTQILPREGLSELMQLIAKFGTPTVGDITELFHETKRPHIMRCIGWLLKFGLCAYANGDNA